MRKLVLAVLLVLMPSLASAATYYVRTDGNNACNGLYNVGGSSGNCAWLTIDYASDNIPAGGGHTVRVQDGTYAETVTPSRNGVDGSPNTFVADGTATVCRWSFSSSSYIRVIGFVIDTNASPCTINNAISFAGINSYLEFWRNDIMDSQVYGMIAPGWGGDHRLNNSIIVNNRFLGPFSYIGSVDGGVCLYLRGSHNFVGHNEFTNSYSDAVYIFGVGNRLVNSYAHDLLYDAANHSDIFQTGTDAIGLSYNLFESTLQIAAGATDEHFTNWGNHLAGGGTMTENVLRRNVLHGNGEYGLGVVWADGGSFSDTRFYHNTSSNLMSNATYASVGYGHAFASTGSPNAFFYNNIEYQSWGTSRTASVSVYGISASLLTANTNLAYDPEGSVTFTTPWTDQASPQSNVNPNFVSHASHDFTLAAGSGDGLAARGTGGRLTTASGSGTGTTFNVATNTGGFFFGSNASNVPQYGGALVPGDTITVGTDVLTVASVSGDAITVTSSFTWADGESVYFESDTTPDIGAYPYKSGGYSISATYAGSGTITITPNDAALVRFVVCYDSGVPYAVDSASPYTCAAATGTFSARVYPKYASTTLWTVATAGGGSPPAAPTNVRIR